MVDDRSFRRWADEGSEVDEPIRRLVERAAAEGALPGAHARLGDRLAPLFDDAPSGGADTEPPPASPAPGGATSLGPAGVTVAGLALVVAVGTLVALGWRTEAPPLRIDPKHVDANAPTVPSTPPSEPSPTTSAIAHERDPKPIEPTPSPTATPAPARARRSPRNEEAAGSTLVAEARLLARAQAALDSSPAAALTLAEEHARRFRRGVLAEEREAIAVEALVGLGRRDAARERADRLLARHPRSTYRTRLEAVLPP